MTEALCPREADVLRACASETWPADLKAHLATCGVCREVESVASVLRAAVALEPADQVPSAHDIWWRAQWQAKQDARARAMRPLDRIERAEPLVALVAVATLLVLRGEAIASRLLAWASSEGTGQALQAVMPPALMPILLIGACLGALVLVAGLGAVVARD